MVNPASLGPGGIALEALVRTEASWAAPAPGLRFSSENMSWS